MSDATTGQYPWGSQSPQSRVIKLEKVITGLKDRKTALREAFDKDMAEIADAEQKTLAELDEAKRILTDEHRQQQVELARKELEKLVFAGIDISEILKSGEFSKSIASMVGADVGVVRGRKAQAPKGEGPGRKGRKPQGEAVVDPALGAVDDSDPDGGSVEQERDAA